MTPVVEDAERLAATEQSRRAKFATRLDRSADAYIVCRSKGKTIVAGYPWFTDWGRDAFIAMRGLCLAIGRLDDARDILLDWAGVVSEGMLPNRYPDQGGVPEYNSVDASLWYIIAVHELCEAYRAASSDIDPAALARLRNAVEEILTGYGGEPAMASASMTMACWRPASQAYSSPGWTSSSAIGWSRRGPGRRSRFRPSGSMR